jgi:uncharacterized membrane protein
LGKLLLGIVMACYPFIVYLTIDRVGPGALGILLIAMLLVRGALMNRRAPGMVWGALLLAAIVASLMVIDDTGIVLKLYPTFINLSLLIVCTYTLIYPPSMIERLIRASGMKPSIKAPTYTRIVTMIWCGFFVLNGLASALTAFSGSLSIWALYNGAIAYALAGTLIVGEMIFRYFYKRHHGLLANQQ